MYSDRRYPDFIDGMHYFLQVAEKNKPPKSQTQRMVGQEDVAGVRRRGGSSRRVPELDPLARLAARHPPLTLVFNLQNATTTVLNMTLIVYHYYT